MFFELIVNFLSTVENVMFYTCCTKIRLLASRQVQTSYICKHEHIHVAKINAAGCNKSEHVKRDKPLTVEAGNPL